MKSFNTSTKRKRLDTPHREVRRLENAIFGEDQGINEIPDFPENEVISSLCQGAGLFPWSQWA